MFGELIPLSGVFSALYLLLVLTFLITTVDSSTLSVAMLTVGGEDKPSATNRVIWGVLVGALTSLLIVTGGLSTLQSFVILVGFPTALMCVISIVGMSIELERFTPVIGQDEPSNSVNESSSGTQSPMKSQMSQSQSED